MLRNVDVNTYDVDTKQSFRSHAAVAMDACCCF
jgi:hypothetical protein